MREVTKHNVVRHESFSARLDDLMRRYLLQQLTSAQVIAELAAMAREVSEEARRGERFDPPLNHAELAFYDAVAQRDITALIAGGDDTLAEIARALVADIRKNLSVDWLSREPVRANSAPASAASWPCTTTPRPTNARPSTWSSSKWRPSRPSGHRARSDPGRMRCPGSAHSAVRGGQGQVRSRPPCRTA
jgi:hypothetical protein